MKKSTFCEAMFAKSTHSLTKLRMHKGCTGLGIYMCVLEALFDESTGMLPKEYDILAYRFGLTEDEVRDVVENYGLFEFTDDGMFYCELLRAQRMPKPKTNRNKPVPRQPERLEEPETVVAEEIEENSLERTALFLRSDTEWLNHTAEIFNVKTQKEFLCYLDEYLGICEEEQLITNNIDDMKKSCIMWLNTRLSQSY